MNINFNETYKTCKCDDCKNNDICAYREEKTKIDKSIKELKQDIPFGSPVIIYSSCKRFEKQILNKNTYSYRADDFI